MVRDSRVHIVRAALSYGPEIARGIGTDKRPKSTTRRNSELLALLVWAPIENQEPGNIGRKPRAGLLAHRPR
jgi:hypothetical protein